jgi:hypothetical protein
MKGWYCIYECSNNQWLMQGSWWQLDREYKTISMPTQFDITKYQLPDGTKDYMLGKYDNKNFLTLGEGKINPWSILKFETIKEAEQFLQNGGFSLTDGRFYTIRKIYF